MQVEPSARKSRERTGTEARKAIQMARYWMDQGDAEKATEWADRAAAAVERFGGYIRREVKAQGRAGS